MLSFNLVVDSDTCITKSTNEMHTKYKIYTALDVFNGSYGVVVVEMTKHA